jgi:Zn-dependent metalloprotease
MTRHTRAPYRIHSGFWTTAVCLALLAPGGRAEADDTPSGKHVGSNKRVGKPSPRVLAADLNRPRPLTLATPNKMTAPAPHVRDAIVQLSARSTTPARVRTSSRGALQRFVGRVANPRGPGLAAAAALLQDQRDALGLIAAPGTVDLVQRSASQEPGDGLHLTLDVTYRGLPVWGAEVAAHFADDGALTAINAQRLGALAPAMTLRFGPQAAQQRARLWNAPAAQDGVVTDLGAPELGVWPGQGEGGALAWRLMQSLRLPDGTPQHYATYVDGNSGLVLARHARVNTEAVMPATGSGTNLFGKPVTLRISYYPEKKSYSLFDRSKGLSAATLQTHDAQGEQHSSALVTSGSKDTWTKSMSTAHDHMQRVIDYFSKTHARNSWDGKGAQVKQLVHYGKDFNNAFWDSWNQYMALGDGDSYFFKEFTRALDVSAHEFAHAVVSGTVDLVYQGQPGALNESFADVMAVMVDRDDWLIGEEIVGPDVFPQGYARSLENPAGGNQPAHMKAYVNGPGDYGGVHINSGIPNHAAYLLATAKSREVVEKIWYRTLYKHHVGSQASFVDMAEGTLTACDELVAAKALTNSDCVATAQAWVGVGVLGAADVPMNGCPTNSSEKGGLCYCDAGFVPSNDGATCVELDQVMCPANSIDANGQCFCKDGFKPNADGSQCVSIDKGCPLNSSWDPALKACACDMGFEGTPNANDGKCEAIASDCPANAHPEWPDPKQQDQYICACNENYEDDGQAGCAVVAGTCGNESFFGRCDAGKLIYCEIGALESEIKTVDCAADGLVCGEFDSVVGFDCLNPKGVAAGGTCDADGYQQCDDSVPFCVSEVDAPEGFCSHECAAKSECAANQAEKDNFDCCATVSDGTRACLKDPFCAENIDTKASCDDVPGGSTYFGRCDGDVLIYCDGSTQVTQEVFCNKLGLECGWVDKTQGYSCVEPDSGALPEAPADWCPHAEDGVCDVPALCPAGSDLVDCNPCGEVPAGGVCEGDTLKVCDPEAGLVTTDCSGLAMTPTCGLNEDGEPACVPGGDTGVPTEGGGDDTTTPDTTGPDSGDSASGDDAGADVGTLSCACRSDGGGWGGLWFGALALAFLRPRRRS